MKQKVASKSNLIALLDQTYPGVNELFDSPVRSDGSEKWVDFAYSFWHVDCVRKAGLKAFTDIASFAHTMDTTFSQPNLRKSSIVQRI